MKKCSSCQQEIDDAAMFCPLCGAKQGAAEKKRYPISERAFCRVFRPSFFGGASALGIKADNLLAFMLDFLSLERQVDDDEISELNHALDRLLNDAANEYALTNDQEHGKYAFAGENRETIENEKFRQNFISDKTFHNLDAHYRKIGKAINGKHFAYVWLFALAASLDGNYSDDKLQFFCRLKKLFPVSREQFIESFVPEGARYDDDQEKSSLGGFFGLVRMAAGEELALIENVDRDGEIEYRQGNNGVTEKITAVDLKAKFPEKFDFYGIVEEKIKALCELEYQIQELEHSEGQYAAIADKIAAAARKERELTAMLPGFVYQKF